jgi:hypothetical protein
VGGSGGSPRASSGSPGSCSCRHCCRAGGACLPAAARTGDEELQDDQDGIRGAHVADVAVHAGHHVGHSLADRDQDAQQLLSARQQVAISLHAVVDVDDLAARQQLHHQA